MNNNSDNAFVDRGSVIDNMFCHLHLMAGHTSMANMVGWQSLKKGYTSQ